MVCMNSVVYQMLVEFIIDLNKAEDAERSMVVEDVVRCEYDNMEVEAIRGNFARKSHNNNSGITQRQ
jgi:hypothetical protein